MKLRRTIRYASIVLCIAGAALFIKSGHSFWEGYSAVKSTDEQNNVFSSYTPSSAEHGEMLGELSFPKLDTSIPIYHGTSNDELDKGIGHVSNSKLPGEEGNIVLSGHRDTVFRRLGELEIGDKIHVQWAGKTFTYKIKKFRIVDKEDRTVLVPKPAETLTITTCYPFRFIGSAPERYVVEAVRLKGV